MEWAQVLAIVIPIVFTIVVGIFYNNRQLTFTNARIDDLRADMNRRFDEVKADIHELKTDTDHRFDDVKADIREIRQFLLRLIPIPEPPKENP